ncbi:MAG: hypothetical protein AAF333_06405 [Planctomycetota bacterium]
MRPPLPVFALAAALLAGPIVSAPASAQSSAPSPRTTEMTFEAGTLIDVTLGKIRPGMEGKFANEYFPAAIPIAMEYGLKPLGTFSVTKIDHGPADGFNIWGFFQWPSLERKQAFEKDPRFAPLREFRDSMMDTKPIQVYTQVPETTTVTLTEGRMYEAAFTWVNPEKGGHLQQYFGGAGPFIAENGVRFLGDFQVTGQSDNPEYAFDSLPTKFFFIDWGSPATKEKWFTSETFRNVGWHRALGLDRLVVIESNFNFPPAAASAEPRPAGTEFVAATTEKTYGVNATGDCVCTEASTTAAQAPRR